MDFQSPGVIALCKIHFSEITEIYVHLNGLQHENILVLRKDDAPKGLHWIGPQRYESGMSDHIFCAYSPVVRLDNMEDVVDACMCELRTQNIWAYMHCDPDIYSNDIPFMCTPRYPVGYHVSPIQHYHFVESIWSIDRDKDARDFFLSCKRYLAPPYKDE